MQIFVENFKKFIFVLIVGILATCLFMFPDQRDMVIGAFLVLIAPEMLENIK